MHVFSERKELYNDTFPTLTADLDEQKGWLHCPPGKQHLKLSTRTWFGRTPWNRGTFVCQSAWCQRSSHWSRASFLNRAALQYMCIEHYFNGICYFLIWLIAKPYQINKGKIWTFCVFRLLIWHQEWVTRVRQLVDLLFLVKWNPEFSS